MRTIKISRKIPLKDLDGGGTLLAQPFADFIRGIRTPLGRIVCQVIDACDEFVRKSERKWGNAYSMVRPLLNSYSGKVDSPYDQVYEKAFEWCGGPGFIGFELLRRGICKKLCIADINPKAIDSVRQTVLDNGLEDVVTYYVSDNLKSIPVEEKFDLVVSNPPNYFCLNPEHPAYEKWENDLRPNDRNWEIHKEFYRTIKGHLNPGAILLISEVEPLNRLVRIPRSLSTPYDVRDRIPLDDFKSMIAEGGLTFLEVTEYFKKQGTEFWMLVSSNGSVVNEV